MNRTALAAKLAHETKVANLRRAVELMAERYAWSCEDRIAARLAGDAAMVRRHQRHGNRRYAALRRLTTSLATLAGGAR
jgi:hypothetical protein